MGGQIYPQLRRQGTRYRKPVDHKDSTVQIKGATSIDERPDVVAEQSRIGHGEIDTVIGKSPTSTVTILERTSKFSLRKKVKKKTAEAVAPATIELLPPYQSVSQ